MGERFEQKKRQKLEEKFEQKEIQKLEEKFELKEMQKLEGHKAKVWCVSWNPDTGTDGKPATLASCSSDKTVRIWQQNPTTSAFDCVRTIEGAETRSTGTVRSCSWSPTGDMLAIAYYDGTTIWKNNENDLSPARKLKGHKKEVVSVSWNIYGQLATCSSDSVQIWGYVDNKECYSIQKLEYSEEYTQLEVEMVQWHPFNENLFSCGDRTIKVWKRYSDHDEWHFAQTLDNANNGHISKVCSISFNATGDKMVTSSADLSTIVWGQGPQRMESDGVYYQPWLHLYTLPGYHKQTVSSVHWSSKGIIASGAADGAICLFEENQDGLERKGAMYKFLLIKKKAHETDVNSVQWGPKAPEKEEAMYEMLFPKKVHETDINSVQKDPELLLERSKDTCKLLLTKAHEAEVTSVQWGPQEIGLLASSSDNGTIKIWKLTPRQ